MPVQEDLLIDSIVFTLDPRDKYLPPGVRRASTTSAIQKRRAQLNPTPKAIHKSPSMPLESEAPPRTSISSHAEQPTMGTQRSLFSVFHKMRQTRSAGSNTRSSRPWSRKLFSRNSHSMKIDSEEDIPAVPKIPSNILGEAKPANRTDDIQLPIQGHSTQSSIDHSTVAVVAPEENAVIPWPQDSTPLGEYQASRPCTARPTKETTSFFRDSGASFGSCSFGHCDELRNSYDIDAAENVIASDGTGYESHIWSDRKVLTNEVTNQGADLATTLNNCIEEKTKVNIVARGPQTAEEQQLLEDKLYATAYAYPDSSLPSYAPSEDFSPGITSNTTHSGPMSPLHLSQPETPLFSDFGDDFDRTSLGAKRYSQSSAQFERNAELVSEVAAPGPPSRAPPPPPLPEIHSITPRPTVGGFQGYSLPNNDHASALTIRKLPSTTLKHSTGGPPVVQDANKQGLVQAWNDGSEHLDDLCYLGELII